MRRMLMMMDIHTIISAAFQDVHRPESIPIIVKEPEAAIMVMGPAVITGKRTFENVLPPTIK